MMEKALLQVEEVTKRFGGLTAVNQVSMHVKQGETVGLIGANGAGKTTLFNLIAGAYHVTSGRILFEGKEIQNMPSHKLARIGIARTYQIVKPFSNLTMLENTMVGALQKHSRVEEARRKAEEVLELVEMGDRKNVRGENLNLPELKRMEVARALATEPKILLLDEPLSALDGVIKESIKERIKTIAREYHLTTIIVTHDPEEALTLSDRVLIINEGRISQYGKPEEIIHQPGNSFIKEFILNQLEIKRNNIFSLFQCEATI